MAETGKEVHRRRPHYSGKYPKRFSEKYKELDPERYGELADHVRSKGNTPAGTHVPIMVKEVLEALRIAPGKSGCDCTLGYGGHSSRILEALSGTGHLWGLDADPIEIEKTTARLRSLGFGEDVFTPVHTNFARLSEVAREHGPFDFVFADLGVSSMQIDNPERGFSWREDAPLDLRFDPTAGVPASELLRSMDREELEACLIDNGDEPFAAEIARALDLRRYKKRPVETTGQLKSLIEECVPKDEAKKSITRTFQAIRIRVNGEYEALTALLEALPGALKPGGRAAILTFHSGEDRLVKKSFQELGRAGVYSEITADVIRPGKEECYDNPRARSTKLRYAVKA